MTPLLDEFVPEEEGVDHPMKYLPIRHVYSSTAPCVSSSGSSNVVSKKVKAQKLTVDEEENKEDKKPIDLFSEGLRWRNAGRPVMVYRRRPKWPKEMPDRENPGNSATTVVKSENLSEEDLVERKNEVNEERGAVSEGDDEHLNGAKRNSVGDGSRSGKIGRRRVKLEMPSLGDFFHASYGDTAGETQRRWSRRLAMVNPPVGTKRGRSSSKESSDTRSGRKWVGLVSSSKTFVYLENSCSA